MSSLIPLVSKDKRQWYNTEKNTAALIQTVVKSRLPHTLSSDQVWSLITLTWISMGKKDVSPTHWERLKVPALETLFGKSATRNSDLAATIDSMNLPEAVAPGAAFQSDWDGIWTRVAAVRVVLEFVTD